MKKFDHPVDITNSNERYFRGVVGEQMSAGECERDERHRRERDNEPAHHCGSLIAVLMPSAGSTLPQPAAVVAACLACAHARFSDQSEFDLNRIAGIGQMEERLLRA